MPKEPKPVGKVAGSLVRRVAGEGLGGAWGPLKNGGELSARLAGSCH